MQKLLLIGALILGLIAGGLGFLSQSKVTGLKQEISVTTGKLATSESNLRKASADLKTAEAAAKDAASKMDAAVAEATAAKDQLQKQTAQVTDLQAQVADKVKQIDELTKKVAEGTGATPGEAAPPASAELEAKLKETETKLAEQTAITQALTGRTKEAEAKAAALQQEKERRDRQLMAKGLEGQVLAVNQAWNFVVLSIGDRQGVVANAQMIIKRGDTMVGKVRITSVEPSTSIADVVPGSLKQGLRVLPGDVVIYAGS